MAEQAPLEQIAEPTAAELERKMTEAGVPFTFLRDRHAVLFKNFFGSEEDVIAANEIIRSEHSLI